MESQHPVDAEDDQQQSNDSPTAEERNDDDDDDDSAPPTGDDDDQQFDDNAHYSSEPPQSAAAKKWGTEQILSSSQRNRTKAAILDDIASGALITKQWSGKGRSRCWETFDRIFVAATDVDTHWAKCRECDAFVCKHANGTTPMLIHSNNHRIWRLRDDEPSNGNDEPAPPPVVKVEAEPAKKRPRRKEAAENQEAGGSGGLFTSVRRSGGTALTTTSPYVAVRSNMSPMLTSYRRANGATSADDGKCLTSIVLPDDGWDCDYPTLARLREILIDECRRDALDDSAQSFLVDLDGVSVLTRLDRLGFRPIDGGGVIGGGEYTWTLSLARK